jgi:hypothetical protein
MVSCARATRGLGRPSLDTRSERSSSPPSRAKVRERWSLDARLRASRPATRHEIVVEGELRPPIFFDYTGLRGSSRTEVLGPVSCNLYRQ